MNVACPYCNCEMENDPNLAGAVVACPHCRSQLTMPSHDIMEARPIQSPTITINHQHSLGPVRNQKHKGRQASPETRIVTAGAILAVVIGVVVVGVYIARVEYTKHAVKTAFKDIGKELNQQHEEGRPFVRDALKARGLVLADNASVRSDGSGYVFAGSAKDSKGMREVEGRIKVAKFSGQNSITLISLVVDGYQVVGE